MENRRLKRRHLIYYLRVYETSNNNLIGHLVDVTSEGLMLISENPIPVNQVYHFRMALQDEIMQKLDINIEVKSVWCKRDVNPDFYATGLTILNILPDDLVVIESLIHKYGFND